MVNLIITMISLLKITIKSRKNEKLYGLGSTWCVAPDFLWKHIGIQGEPEIIVRRKCITLLLSIMLLILVVGTDFSELEPQGPSMTRYQRFQIG